MILKTSFDIRGIAAALPKTEVDNLADATALFGDAAKARDVVAATGIHHRRVAAPGVSSLDLCVAAAERLLAETRVARESIGAVVAVTFTPERAMPGNAQAAQRRLALSESALAFDVGLACSGYVYGLFLASLLAAQTGRPTLLLDGDVQSAHVGERNTACRPVLADAGTATIVAPGDGSRRTDFAFLTKGAGGDALSCAPGGEISMDGFAVFRFVAEDVARFLKGFLAEAGTDAAAYDAFVPHQANLYMVRQLGKSLGFAPDAVWTSAAEFGNPASASVPLTLAGVGAASPRRPRRLLVAGFGGGLSAAVCDLTLAADAPLCVFDCD